MATPKKQVTDLTLIEGGLTPTELLNQARIDSLDLDWQEIEAKQELIQNLTQYQQVSKELDAAKELLDVQLENAQRQANIETVKEQNQQVTQQTTKKKIQLTKIKSFLQS